MELSTKTKLRKNPVQKSSFSKSNNKPFLKPFLKPKPPNSKHHSKKKNLDLIPYLLLFLFKFLKHHHPFHPTYSFYPNAPSTLFPPKQPSFRLCSFSSPSFRQPFSHGQWRWISFNMFHKFFNKAMVSRH